MPLLLGGPKCYKHHAYKQFVVYYEWFDYDTDTIGKGEPTIFIRRKYAGALAGNRGSIAIQLPKAHLYADSVTGGPTPYLVAFAMGACKELGLEPSRQNIRQIADCIVDNLPDLLRMPPAPRDTKFQSDHSEKKAAEATIFVDGTKVSEQSVVLH
jgi:hypothetical protein